jgi:hypothetical protein
LIVFGISGFVGVVVVFALCLARFMPVVVIVAIVYVIVVFVFLVVVM